jgi:NADH:ubiquinone oxidoreductase subunit E
MSSTGFAELLQQYPPVEGSLIEILHDVQLAHRYLPRPALEAVAAYCEIPLARVMSVATFYKAFSLEPKGEVVLKVCMGTACHVKGAGLLLDEAERLLGCKCGETTADGKYTLEEVNCVGACAMAPLVIEDEQYHGKFKPVDMKTLLKTGE